MGVLFQKSGLLSGIRTAASISVTKTGANTGRVLFIKKACVPDIPQKKKTESARTAKSYTGLGVGNGQNASPKLSPCRFIRIRKGLMGP